MQRLPSPPEHFPVPADVKTLPAGTVLWRIYDRAGAHPAEWNQFRYFGPLQSRFDHHTRPKRDQARGILYAAEGRDAILAVLAEAFQETRLIDRSHREPWLVGFELVAGVDLNNSTGLWPVRAGGGMTINSGSRAAARTWSRRIYREYPEVQGIYFPSSLTNQPVAALYERGAGSMPSTPVVHRALADPTLLSGLTVLAHTLGWPIK